MRYLFPPFINFAGTTAALLALMVGFSNYSTVDAADPHQHGVGQLNVAIQGDHVEIELETPGADIVGFEHPPRTAEQKKAVQDAATTLRNGSAIFVFPAAARCELEKTKVESGLLEDNHETHEEKHHDEKHHGEKHHGEKHKEEIHAEFHALYHFSCKNPASYTDLQYFEAFPHAKALLARTITAKGQRKQRLTRKAPRLIF